MATNISAELAVATYNFDGSKILHGLSLEVGDRVIIETKQQGWFYGTLIAAQVQKGIFPTSYVQRIENPSNSSENASAEEVTNTIRDWSDAWINLFMNSQDQELQLEIMEKLDLLEEVRTNLLQSRYYSQYQLRKYEELAALNIDRINRNLGTDIIPRKSNRLVDAENLNLAQLYQAVDSKTDNAMHLLLKLKVFAWNLQDVSDIIVALYDNEEQQFISDNYVVQEILKGAPIDKKQIGCLNCVFSNITHNAAIDNLYLVFRVIRITPIIRRNKPNVRSKTPFRQPFGCAVMSIKAMKKSKINQDRNIVGYVFDSYKDRVRFASFHDYIIEKMDKDTQTLNDPFDIGVSYEIFQGNLDKIRSSNRYDFTNVTVVPRLTYLDWTQDKSVNNLYVTILRAEVKRVLGEKTKDNNIEVTASLISKPNKDPITNCFSEGANVKQVTQSSTFITYHDNDPSWKETFKISLPETELDRLYVKFTIMHCSSKPNKDRLLGICHLKLLKPNLTVVNDGPYILSLHKDKGEIVHDEIHTNKRSGRQSFTFKDDSLMIVTRLCSTRLTQDVNLQRLLNWFSELNTMETAIDAFSSIKHYDLLKFASKTLNSLLAIISRKASNSLPEKEFREKVFEALISLIKIIKENDDNLAKNFFNNYVDSKFNVDNAYGKIMDYVIRQLDSCLTGEVQAKTYENLKMIPYLLKFAIASYKMENKDGSNLNKIKIRSDCNDLLDRIYKIFKEESSSDTHSSKNTDIRICILSIFMDVFKEMKSIIDIDEKILITLLRVMDKNVDDPKFIEQKIMFIKAILADTKLIRYGYETKLIPACFEQLKQHMNYDLTSKECSQIFDILLDLLGLKDCIVVQDEHQHYNNFSKLQLTLTNTIITRQSYTEDYTKAIVVLLDVLQLSQGSDIFDQLKALGDRQKAMEMMIMLFLVFKRLLNETAFPKNWFYMKLAVCKIVTESLTSISKAMVLFCLQKNYSNQVWDSYFNLINGLILSQTLQLESFPYSKRRRILERYGDLRIVLAKEAARSWELLENNREKHIPDIVGSILEMSMLPVKEIRGIMLPILFDIILFEFNRKRKITDVEIEALTKTHALIISGKGNFEYKRLFYMTLSDMMSKYPLLEKECRRFINNMDQLIDRLLDYRDYGLENEDVKMRCLKNLIEFYDSIDYETLHIRYIFTLYQEHNTLENYLQAGFTLLHYANKLSWSDKQLQPVAMFVGEPEYRRKENVYKIVIDLFDKGEAWDCIIPICKDLIARYEEELDFRKLTGILKKYAETVDKILNSRVIIPLYYHVGFYGQDLPEFVCNKSYIYSSLHQISDFCSIMQSYFPKTQLLSPKADPEDYYYAPGQHIQIAIVKPITDFRRLSSSGIEKNVKRCLQRNGIDTFEKSLAITVGKTDNENEFKSLGLRKYRLKTEQAFPGMLSWFEVIDCQKTEHKPVEHAVISLQEQLESMEGMISELKDSVNANVEPLTRSLQGIIAAPVNGGLRKYQEAFICSSYIEHNYEDTDVVANLYITLLKLLWYLKEALNIHERLISQEMNPLHLALVEKLQNLEKELTGKGEFLESLPGTKISFDEYKKWKQIIWRRSRRKSERQRDTP